MYNTALNPSHYQWGYGAPSPEVGAVNISINGVNTPGTAPMQNIRPVYYPVHYYYPVQQPAQYYCAPQTPPQQPQNPPQEKAISSQSIKEEETPETKTEEARPVETEKAEKKDVTPINDELINGLNAALTQGDKQTRIHAIANVMKLLREDPESRKNNPKLIGLINTSLHPNQPGEVREAATIACKNGLVKGNDLTKQLLGALANKDDRYGVDSLAASALSGMSEPGQRLDYTSSQALDKNPDAGQRLNVISQ